MNRIEGLTVAEPASAFMRHRAAEPPNRAAKAAVLLAYAASGWVALVGAAFLLLELL